MTPRSHDLPADLDRTLLGARATLLDRVDPRGHWRGHLSTSALSTATAVTALAVVDAKAHAEAIDQGAQWLLDHANDDGGWGDTVLSKSNSSTTVLCWSALAAVGRTGGAATRVLARAEAWLRRRAGGLDDESLARAVAGRYGQDRTFSAPILSLAALAGRLGPGRQAWRHVAALPFELAVCPHRWYQWLRMPVVSYALPALIAIGLARHVQRPSRNPLARLVRHLAVPKALRVLERIQPRGGGFLEAAPLTSFVVMNLVAAGRRDHPVVREGVRFLLGNRREDGSWPIDTDLATWVTTLSVCALGADGSLEQVLEGTQRRRVRDWLLDQQYRREHPYTHAAPGGWAWTNLPGGVPDADDTPGAMLALRHLGGQQEPCVHAAAAGARWLADLQNTDGGIPTFCRGWGRLPFDRSSPDLTAHTIRAWLAWRDELGQADRARLAGATDRAVAFLRASQRSDGAWEPLWFGNQHATDDENPTYGTSRVLLALAALVRRGRTDVQPMLDAGAKWLAGAQSADGGWSGAAGIEPSIEETAVAVEALASARLATGQTRHDANLHAGVGWLIEHTNAGRSFAPSPIGFYFAKLWYYEELYPVIFTTAALGRARRALES